MSEPARPHPIVKYIYTHNPFYAISASLMLYAVLKAYGTLEVGAINTWIMAGVLAGYTLLLAVIGVLIVRRGKVWEDARSILLLLLALFVAVSICADDLFVRATSTRRGRRYCWADIYFRRLSRKPCCAARAFAWGWLIACRTI